MHPSTKAAYKVRDSTGSCKPLRSITFLRHLPTALYREAAFHDHSCVPQLPPVFSRRPGVRQVRVRAATDPMGSLDEQADFLARGAGKSLKENLYNNKDEIEALMNMLPDPATDESLLADRKFFYFMLI
jgi:hypothetical protein